MRGDGHSAVLGEPDLGDRLKLSLRDAQEAGHGQAPHVHGAYDDRKRCSGDGGSPPEAAPRAPEAAASRMPTGRCRDDLLESGRRNYAAFQFTSIRDQAKDYTS